MSDRDDVGRSPRSGSDTGGRSTPEGAGVGARPGGAPEAKVYVCDLCGNEMLDLHCKLVCERCGYKRDCSDP